MNQSGNIAATPWKESSGTCACCGRISKTIWGDLSSNAGALAVYYVQWTIGAPDHYPNIDLIIGEWGDGANAEGRYLVSVVYRPIKGGGSFMVIDSDGRASKYHTLLSKAMQRAEVIGTPAAQEAFALVDAIWLTDPRISEMKDLDNV